MPEYPEILSPLQAAKFLGIRPETLSKWRCEKSRSLPFIRTGRFVRYRLKDLREWLESNIEIPKVER